MWPKLRNPCVLHGLETRGKQEGEQERKGERKRESGQGGREREKQDKLQTNEWREVGKGEKGFSDCLFLRCGPSVSKYPIEYIQCTECYLLCAYVLRGFRQIPSTDPLLNFRTTGRIKREQAVYYREGGNPHEIALEIKSPSSEFLFSPHPCDSFPFPLSRPLSFSSSFLFLLSLLDWIVCVLRCGYLGFFLLLPSRSRGKEKPHFPPYLPFPPLLPPPTV